MTWRVRHCVECPKCRTRYLIGFSPYHNGSYLVPVATGSMQEWILYCACGSPPNPSRWNWDELQPYEVCRGAHVRGYGAARGNAAAQVKSSGACGSVYVYSSTYSVTAFATSQQRQSRVYTQAVTDFLAAVTLEAPAGENRPHLRLEQNLVGSLCPCACRVCQGQARRDEPDAKNSQHASGPRAAGSGMAGSPLSTPVGRVMWFRR